MKLEITLQSAPRRQRYKETPYSDRVALIIAKNYESLRYEFVKGECGNYSSMSYEDIFHETILYVIQDKKAFALSETDILNHFRFRYNMVKFQIIQDSKLVTKYANDLQAPEE